jgi:hypothetical protein
MNTYIHVWFQTLTLLDETLKKGKQFVCKGFSALTNKN